ncbi:hypothetical protein SAMD00019534_042040 [Acytostelium subglobosum LB1]|uniref:hypothetical protein n=1 Tax=Acytostelium subglobosum LB1 TaxID=1410327 RepID=UPI0006451D36|nr:hypothetical protein SAMD00019534_042040 [Acytostelium subglobosum LB1]GAM21029.1 hypothetical protein SAMD00019534_042040 [Acytostelium subglobosum LB1]|eukprot:XP_012756163.1 hypothetical protein SAMD00019534_042040 [Acytostelium subglobosum LB1]
MRLTTSLIITLICIIGCVAVLDAQSVLTPKNLAGPPSEFEGFALPDSKQVAHRSNSALSPITFTKSRTSGKIEWIANIPVDTDHDFTLSIISNFTSELTLIATPPKKGCPRTSLHHNKPIVSSGTFGIDGNTIPSTSYLWEKAVVGEWTVKVTAPHSLLENEHFTRQLSANSPSAFLLALNPSEFEIYTYLESYTNLFVGQQVPVLAMLTSNQEELPVGARPIGYTPSPLLATNVSASMIVITPQGQETNVPMFDDGLHADGQANDGLYGAFLQPTTQGNYVTSVVFIGTSPQGNGLFRTTQHLIPITTQYVTLSGNVQATQTSDELVLNFEVASAEQNAPAVRLYSEVHGTNAAGQQVPIAWVQGVTPVQKSVDQLVIQALLNNRWIAAANATAPFFVSNVIVSDMSTFVPLSESGTTQSAVKMAANYIDVRALQYDPPLNIITKEMRDGKMPKELADRYGKSSTATGNGKLILVHGYCAKLDPFTLGDFENYASFRDFSQNRPTDTFAKMIADFAANLTDGFSLVSHSQGGLASLHLATFYHSYLDLSLAYEGRLIQSMGSPYQGTALAGSLATIGGAIGIGCSSSSDMTLDGAALWLNSIPADKRALVYFTTTQYGTGALVNYCNLAANSVLSWPNDGVTDSDHNFLPGATFANHFKGWCHSPDLHFPAQCTYKQNNDEFNSNSIW